MHLNQVGGRSLRAAWCNNSREVDGILEVLEGLSSCSNGSTFASSCVDDKMVELKGVRQEGRKKEEWWRVSMWTSSLRRQASEDRMVRCYCTLHDTRLARRVIGAVDLGSIAF
jgi:hypothetical protein